MSKIAAVGLAVMIAACGGGGDAPAADTAQTAAPAPAPASAGATHDVNMVMEGTTYKFVPAELSIKAGDQVVFHMPGEDSIYEVKSTQIVVPTDLWVIDQTPTSTFTLIACHPKHSAAQRIVIKGDFVSKHKTNFKL